jgi:hypothetical protein
MHKIRNMHRSDALSGLRTSTRLQDTQEHRSARLTPVASAPTIICICTHSYTHTYTCRHIHTYCVLTLTHTHTHADIYTHVQMHVHIRTEGPTVSFERRLKVLMRRMCLELKPRCLSACERSSGRCSVSCSRPARSPRRSGVAAIVYNY